MQTNVKIGSFIGLFCLAVKADGEGCTNISLVQNGLYLNRGTFRHTDKSSLYDCASECMASSSCQSFHFNTDTLTCHPNMNNRENVDSDPRRGVIISDIKHWDRSLTGPCFNVSCNGARCQVLRNEQTQCVPELQKHAASQEVPEPSVISPDDVTCMANFMPCDHKAGSITVEKEDISQTCERFRWHNLVNIFRRIQKKSNVSGFSLRNGSTILFHIAIRPEQTAMVLNTCLLGKWQEEIRPGFDPYPFKAKKTFLLEVMLNNGTYQVSVDGTLSADFKDRFPNAKPTEIEVGGFIRVSSLEVITWG